MAKQVTKQEQVDTVKRFKNVHERLKALEKEDKELRAQIDGWTNMEDTIFSYYNEGIMMTYKTSHSAPKWDIEGISKKYGIPLDELEEFKSVTEYRAFKAVI